ncbi:MAG: cytochrome c biogenesis CcdA family protein [Peptococcaceae bacterium]|nr:cytochrome c biogenesis CcdA family protein [Peptococcaceae bacterium]
MEEYIEGLVHQVIGLISQMPWLAPLLALCAGMIAAFTPCCLSGIPLIIGYISGTGERTPRRAFFYSLTFAAGTALTFVLFGIFAHFLGHLVDLSSPFWHGVVGVLMLLMALEFWDVIHIIPETQVVAHNARSGFVGAFLTGMLAGVFASPCSVPILVMLLAIVAGGDNLALGVVLMLCYGIGHSVLVMIAGTSMGFVERVKSDSKYQLVAFISKSVLGLLMCAFAALMLMEAFGGHVHL